MARTARYSASASACLPLTSAKRKGRGSRACGMLGPEHALLLGDHGREFRLRLGEFPKPVERAGAVGPAGEGIGMLRARARAPEWRGGPGIPPPLPRISPAGPARRRDRRGSRACRDAPPQARAPARRAMTCIPPPTRCAAPGEAAWRRCPCGGEGVGECPAPSTRSSDRRAPTRNSRSASRRATPHLPWRRPDRL